MQNNEITPKVTNNTQHCQLCHFSHDKMALCHQEPDGRIPIFCSECCEPKITTKEEALSFFDKISEQNCPNCNKLWIIHDCLQSPKKLE